MGIEAAATDRSVTSQAVALDVTADARFQVLARSLPVTQREEPFGVVIAGGAEWGTGGEPRGGVTADAEAPGVVAIAAAVLSRIRRRWVARQETGRVISRAACGGRPVAVEAVRANVTSGTRRRRRRQSGMSLGERRPK